MSRHQPHARPMAERNSAVYGDSARPIRQRLLAGREWLLLGLMATPCLAEPKRPVRPHEGWAVGGRARGTKRRVRLRGHSPCACLPSGELANSSAREPSLATLSSATVRRLHATLHAAREAAVRGGPASGIELRPCAPRAKFVPTPITVTLCRRYRFLSQGPYCANPPGAQSLARALPE